MLAVLLCPPKALPAADSVAPPSSNAITAALEYQETGYAVFNLGVSLNLQTAPFKKEPAALSGKIIRGVLNFGDDDSQAIPFLWQRDARKLFLDLNRNRDLTDDPSGVFVARLAEPAYYQRFTNIHLLFNTPSGKCPVLADINLYQYGPKPYCYLMVRSLWQAKLALQGRDWQVGVVQNFMEQPGSFDEGRLLLRSWDKRNQPFNADDGSLATVPFSRKLFLDGHAYKLECLARPQNGEARPSLQFTEQSVPLGALSITGQFIRRFVLTGGPYLVMLDDPAGVVKVPTGNYIQPDIQLEEKGVEAFCKAGLQQVSREISVNDKTTAVVHEGGPLTNSVIAGRHGQDLRLDYRLVGVGGEVYQQARPNYSKPPQFAIYKSAKKIASGTFEYG